MGLLTLNEASKGVFEVIQFNMDHRLFVVPNFGLFPRVDFEVLRLMRSRTFHKKKKMVALPVLPLVHPYSQTITSSRFLPLKRFIGFLRLFFFYFGKNIPSTSSFDYYPSLLKQNNLIFFVKIDTNSQCLRQG